MTLIEKLKATGGPSQELEEALAKALRWEANATPQEKQAMREKQRQSWVKAFEPCEHGVADFETCSSCRLSALEGEQG